jgi:hypothetical protein
MAGEPHESLLTRFFDSFLQERNIQWMLALGVFILLASSMLLIAPGWSGATPAWRCLVFLFYSAAAYFAGEWTYHRLGLRKTGTVFLGITVLLIPILFLALGRTVEGKTPWIDIPLATATCGFAFAAARRVFRHFLRDTQPTFLACYLILAAAGGVLPLVTPHFSSILGFALWAVFAVGATKVARHVFWLTEEHRKPRIFGFFPITLLAGQFLTLFILCLAPQFELQWFGVGCVLVAIPILTTADAVARVFQERTGDLVRPLPWSIMAPLGVGLVLVAAGIGLTAPGLIPPNLPYAMWFAAAIATVLLILVARRTGKQAFVWAALVTLTMAYQSTPAFFIEVVKQLRDQGAHLVREDRLPYAFYGLTYLPLLIGLTAFGTRNVDGPGLFIRPVRRFAAGMACILLAASLTHAKAMFPVGAVLTAVFATQVALFRRQYLALGAIAAFALAAFGLDTFLHGILGLPLPVDFPLFALTAATAIVFGVGRRIDSWLANLTPLPVLPQLCGRVSMFASVGLATFWFARAVMIPLDAGWIAGAMIAALLFAQGLRELAFVLLNWQAILWCMHLLVPGFDSFQYLELADVRALLIPIATMASAAAFIWQHFAERPNASLLAIIQHRSQQCLFAGLMLLSTAMLSSVDAVGAGLVIAAFALAIVAEGISACRRQRESRAWIAAALAAAAIGYLAYFRVLIVGGGLGMFLLLGLAFVLWIGRELAYSRPQLKVLARPLGTLAYLMPSVSVALGVGRHLIATEPSWRGATSLAILLAGGFYFWRGLELRRRDLLTLAGVILNVALALLWRELQWSDPQFFLIPLGLTVLALVQLFREELPTKLLDPLRYLGALVILVSPVFHIVEGSWVHLFTMMVASVVVVLLGIGLRVRALVYMGTAFLLADLIAMLVRGSFDHPNLLWLAGLSLGAAVLTLAAYCERNREALLQRMRLLAQTLEGWE